MASSDHGNKIIIITAPSRAGKTSITRYFAALYSRAGLFGVCGYLPGLGNEKDGADYYFMSADEFQQKIQDQAFVEWEMVYGGQILRYPEVELERIWKKKQVPVLDIDVKGAIHVQQQYPNLTLSIFIEPPSVDELKRRLESRGTETVESLQARVNKASYEISFKHHFHQIIVNAQLDKAREEAMCIVRDFLKT